MFNRSLLCLLAFPLSIAVDNSVLNQQQGHFNLKLWKNQVQRSSFVEEYCYRIVCYYPLDSVILLKK